MTTIIHIFKTIQLLRICKEIPTLLFAGGNLTILIIFVLTLKLYSLYMSRLKSFILRKFDDLLAGTAYPNQISN